MANYAFTIIVFHDDSEKFEQTSESLCGSAWNVKYRIQMIAVTEEGEEISDTVKQMLIQNGIALEKISMTEDNREVILEKALEKAEGSVINLTKAGILFDQSVLKRVNRYMERSGFDKVFVPVRSVKSSAIMKEMNAYQKKCGKHTDLGKNYHIVHCNYFAYFLKKEAISKKDCRNDSWTFSVLLKLFYSIVTDCKLGFVKNTKLQSPSPVEVMQPWLGMLKEGEFQYFFENFLLEMLDFCKENSDIAIKNAKYNLIYYCSRILDNYNFEEHEDGLKIKEMLFQVFDYIKDEEILLVNQYLKRAYKYYLEKNFKWNNADNNKEIATRKKEILDLSLTETVYQFIELSDKNKLVLECRVTLFVSEFFEVYFKVNDNFYPAVIQKKEDRIFYIDEMISRTLYAKCEIPIQAGCDYTVSVQCRLKGLAIEKEMYNFGTFFPLYKEMPSYYEENGWCVFFDKDNNELKLSPVSKKRSCGFGFRRTRGLLLAGKASRKALLVRSIVRILRGIKKKEIWLISDRTIRGDDNGEIFFRYVCGRNLPDVNAYYVIDKNVPDYKRMKQYGKVIPVYSWRHKILHLLSDYVISSQANKPVINPFGKISVYYKEIIAKKKYIFLQHGVIKDDLSSWLNRYNRNLYGFVVTTKAEYQSILDYDYYYTPKEVWLTGLPRHDMLEHNEKKYITIVPTWRKTLTGGTDAKGVWQIGDDFMESEYFKFYDDLLNNERLLSEAKEYQYTICFMPHPNVKPALPLFRKHPDVIFWDENKTYNEMFAESDLLVTDYSSVVFDFAYLRKPVLYCQFDRDEFFAGGHSYVEGYYNYMEDGFGEVETDMDGIVERIIEYMQNGCQLKEKYQDRIEQTFAFKDKNCSKRVLDKFYKERVADS